MVIADPRALFFDAPGSTRYPPLNATYSVGELFSELYVATMNRVVNSPSELSRFAGRAYHHADKSPNESAGMLGMFARNMQYCGSVTISFVNESLPQRDDPLLREVYHEDGRYK